MMAGNTVHVASYTLGYFCSILDGHVYRTKDGNLMLAYGLDAAWTFVAEDEQQLMENIVGSLLAERREAASGTPHPSGS